MDVFSEIADILMEILDLEGREITPESYLVRDLGAESIDFLELATALNERFKITVREEDIFLKGTKERLRSEEIPFLTEKRAAEIAADPACGPVVKVKDLVSYVHWQLLQMKK
ncbi:MAG: phosphopantetheine-binding protein [Syntrophales bacterium LBB04]|nr:phosphopantetheine-binding protein [Syntrophales bacterium LBB04]